MTEPATFTAYSQYYDLFYHDKDYRTEVTKVIELMTSLNPSTCSILELGCGTGNHAEYLSEAGYTITGLERSAEMVALANEKAIPNFKPILADVRHFKLGQKFDVALSLFHVVSYLTQNEDLISCFQSVNNHLESGGYFVFDAWFSPAVYYNRPETRIKRRSTGNIDIIRLAEPVIDYHKNIVDVHYEILVKDGLSNEIEVIKEKHSMRHYSCPEIELLAEVTGFQLIAEQDLMSGEKPSENTWGVCFILKKNREPYTR